MAKAKVNLLPCPLCGKKPYLSSKDLDPEACTGFFSIPWSIVVCSCGVEFDPGSNVSEENLIQRWNTRL